MPSTPTFPRAAVCTAVLCLLAACGGGDADKTGAAPGPEAGFRSYALAHPSSTGGSPPAGAQPLSAEQAQEVGRLSRGWAVAALDSGRLAYLENTWTLPSLHFARQAVVAAAAYGQTLAELNQAVALPSADVVAAGLAQGVSRSISALGEGRFGPRFLSVATGEAAPDTWASLSLRPLSATQLAADGNTRMQIDDTAQLQASWPQASPERGVWESPNGRLDVAVVRIRAPLLRHDGADYAAVGLPLAGGTWLVQITAQAHGPAWAGTALGAALTEVAAVIAARAGGSGPAGTVDDWVLPVMRLDEPQERGSLAGMGLAQDEVNADLRGLDAGGTYFKPSALAGSLSIGATGLEVTGALSTRFIFSPRNTHGGGSTGGVVVTRVDPVVISPSPLPACPVGAASLKPFHLALMRPNGSISLLARVARFSGTPCQ